MPWTRLDVSETGLAAVVRLSNGDMRKALNILQVIIPLLRCFLFVYLSILLSLFTFFFVGRQISVCSHVSTQRLAS